MLCSMKVLLFSIALAPVFAQQARLDILLPERTRLLVRQRIDLVIEARGGGPNATLRVTANQQDITRRFTASQAELDCNGTPATVYRANLNEFSQPGKVVLTAELTAGAAALRSERTLEIKPFDLPASPRNYILFIGDAMATAYRDAGRIVSRSAGSKPGVPGLREGFFDRWLEMDQMPVTGLVMTYGFANLVPDSAETSTHWSTGNKPLTGMLSSFPDGTDCEWRNGSSRNPLAAITDNPRIESFLEYLKRLHHYRTGNVSTAFIADATPAGQGSHVATRGATFEIARQYLENPMLDGAPAFDVLLGGGEEDFDADT